MDKQQKFTTTNTFYLIFTSIKLPLALLKKIFGGHKNSYLNRDSLLQISFIFFIIRRLGKNWT